MHGENLKLQILSFIVTTKSYGIIHENLKGKSPTEFKKTKYLTYLWKYNNTLYKYH